MANPIWQGDSSTNPNDWSFADNWDGAAVPVNSDSAYMRSNAVNASAGLAQSAVTLTLLEVERSFEGDIGSATSELAIGATTFNLGRHIGDGSPAGSDRIKITFGSVQTAINVWFTASSAADSFLEPCRLRGTHASNVAKIYGGIVGFATNDPDDLCTLLTLDVFGGKVNCGAGCTLGTINNLAGDLTIRSAATTINQAGGTLNIYGAGAYTTIKATGGQTTNYGTGTITALTTEEGAAWRQWSPAMTITTLNLGTDLDLSQATGDITVGTFNAIRNGIRIIDPLGRLAQVIIVKAAGVTDVQYIGSNNIEVQ